MARRDDGVLGSDFTIGLDTKLELGDQRVRHLSESVSIIQILAKETSIYPRTLYPAKRTWWLCKRRERSKLPKVWSSLLKVKMADEGIPEQVNHISTLFFKQSKKEPTGINLDFNLVLARTKDKGFVSMKQDSISNLSRNEIFLLKHNSKRQAAARSKQAHLCCWSLPILILDWRT